MKTIFTLLTCLVIFVMLIRADEIDILQPNSSSIFHPGDKMTIEYNVKNVGMTKIWGTFTTLTHDNKTIQGFPAHQNIGYNRNYSNTWIIPKDVPNGTFTLMVGGNITYLCSNDSKPPYKHCQDVIYQSSTFTILKNN
ncbi:uncharacterized protein RHIMIDRAFT_293142 [Rhizopus microsporus ATCC 52813]|uniref:CARDB domain-containing protein n=1 Tax=Rhizopus microsporus ATCC 52813 TaxID=1340429 RepID=A0A2G4SQ99_RHIZD|nr:uncharacterized protein RHIMIDRAFT_293142 [Rhizopus microsporus ATCC 52813]PHZ10930.1 hypothetical protein RHIMIDRAFT_293142 [Rhizopus microsporus ATCC 52813]